jgi:hypothetical protein
MKTISFLQNEQTARNKVHASHAVNADESQTRPTAKVVAFDYQAQAEQQRINKKNVIRLTDRERQALKKALAPIYYEDSGNSNYINSIKKAALAALPNRIQAALHEQKMSLHPRPYLIFDNLPTDDEVFGSPSSTEPSDAYKSGYISENLAIAFSSLIGEPYSISFEGINIVNNLTPERGKEKDFTGLGSDVELDFHIENAALKFIKDLSLSPTGLVLTGVRQDSAMPKTRVADANEALLQLDPQDLAILRGDNFRLKVPYRWRNALGANGMIETDPVPLISGCTIQPEVHVAFYSDMVTPLNEASKKAFQNFHDAVKRVSFGLDVTPGRLIYIDNRFALHSRDRFKANYDENDSPMRWIQRVFVSATLWHHRSLRRVKERVFEPILLAA